VSLRVAVVGTGRMGAAMVGRVRGGGFPVVVHNRTREKAESVAAMHGAEVAGTPREAASGADIVLVSLPDDAAARTAYLGADGLVAGLRPGTVVADTSTLGPSTVRELADEVARAEASLLDAPVSGSVSTVEAGGLTVMVGGPEASLDRARPVLATMAGRVVHLGEAGAGAVMKLAVNSILHALNIALCEGLLLAERAGIDRATAYDVIAGSAAGAPFVGYKRDAFMDPDGTPVAFALDLVAKDLGLADGLAADLGADVRQLAANREVVDAAIGAGFGASDLSAIAVFLRSEH
jgi:3-hydroxyisobutyrate dehydrogenase-like beta-hydroxyacid dehydrogenase